MNATSWESKLRPIGDSEGASYSNHLGQSMWSAMRAEWITSQTSSGRRGVFQSVLCTSRSPQDRTVSIVRLTEKRGDSLSARSVKSCKHKTCAKIANMVSVITRILSALCLLRSFSAQSWAWLHNSVCSQTTSTSLRPLFNKIKLPQDGHNGKVYILSPSASGYDKEAPLYV